MIPASCYHFQDLCLLSRATITRILKESHRRKKQRHGLPKGMPDKEQTLFGHTLAMIFQKPSTRTRLSFQMAMTQLGGSYIILDEDNSQMGRGESMADTVRVLSRYADIMIIRCTDHSIMLDILAHSSIPVINALTEESHPCQVLADVMTLQEHVGSLDENVVSWVGAFTNVTRSWLHICTVMGWVLHISCPFMPTEDSDSAPSNIRFFSSPEDAVESACCVITDTWHSMGEKQQPSRKNLLPFQVNSHLMDQAPKKCLVMHCLPAHQGEEITHEVFEKWHNVIFDEAENRLHVQKAILCDILGN